MRVGVVVNPAAGSGRMAKALPELRAALGRHFRHLDIVETRASGQGSALARGLVAAGVDLVIAAGGDGTVSETADGMLRAAFDDGRHAQFAIVPVGTGSDMARGLGLKGSIHDIARRIADGPSRSIDAGHVSFLDDSGQPADRYFISIASLGVSGPTDRAVNTARTGSLLPGKAVFYLHTVRELLRYRFQAVRVTVDDHTPVEATIALVACANNRFFGGGMMIAPDALMDNGLLEVVIVRGTSKLQLVRDLRLVYSGAHRALPSCTFLRGRTISVEPLGDAAQNGALLDIDGESPGRIPATFQVLPGAITIRG